MADSTTIGLGGYDPYRAKIEATKSLDAYSRAFTEPVQQFGTLLNVNNAADKARQIKQILAQPYILENGEIDYQQLGQDLMPLDTDLANKYLDLASAQVLKRETLAASTTQKDKENASLKAQDISLMSKDFDGLNLIDESERPIAWDLLRNKWLSKFSEIPETYSLQNLNKILLLGGADTRGRVGALTVPEKIKSLGNEISRLQTSYSMVKDSDPVKASTYKNMIVAKENELGDLTGVKTVVDNGTINLKPDELKSIETFIKKDITKSGNSNPTGLEALITEITSQDSPEIASAKRKKINYLVDIAIEQKSSGYNIGIEEMKYKDELNARAYNALQSSPEYTSYKATNDAIATYNASLKDMGAKRKLLYDYIKSYNSGTVLDSELSSTIGGTTIGAGLMSAIKNKVGLESLNTMTDAQINPIVENMGRGLSLLKKNLDNKATELNTLYKSELGNKKSVKHDPVKYPNGPNGNGQYYRVDPKTRNRIVEGEE